MTVEINPPHEGIRRTAGVFLRDELEGLYVGHDGTVRGRPGISRRAFREFAQDLEWKEIKTPNGLREVVVFGPFQGRELLSKLARYVRTVAEFRNRVAAGLR
jgi:hypothetical protein